jgi:hypothetical protein
LLNFHAPAAAVALLTAAEIAVQIGGEQREPGGDPFNEHDEGRPVGLAGGEKAEMTHKSAAAMVCGSPTNVAASRQKNVPEVPGQRGPVRIAVHAKPNARKSAILAREIEGNLVVWKIAIAAPPVDGAANEELRRFLAKALGLPKSAVEVARGETGKHKSLAVTGIASDRVEELLGNLANPERTDDGI